MISVIVPIYKVEKYISECVESILSQTYKDFELILVDDGSPDESGKICDQLALSDSRIKVIHKKNEGVTLARKAGFDASIGDWICFVDGDDLLPENALEQLVVYENSFDIVVGQVKFNGPYKWPFPAFNHEYDQKKYIQNLLIGGKIHGGPVAKLFKRSLFSNFVFSIPRKIKNGEDFLMNLRIAQKINHVKMIDGTVYFYIYRENSADTQNSFSSFIYFFSFVKFMLKSFKNIRIFFESFPFLLYYIIRSLFRVSKRKIGILLSK